MPCEVVACPAPPNPFEPLVPSNNLGASVLKAIDDAEQSYRSGLYSPALTCAGRALEGILIELSGGKSGRKLYDLIEDLCGSEQALEPLKKLAHAVRKGRNVGAHFDVSIEADERSARLMIELLRDLVSYFCRIPEKIAELETLLSKDET